MTTRLRVWSRTSDVNSWSSSQIRQLRDLALQGFTVGAIAAHLRRSESAIRNKAGMHGISLRSAERGACAADQEQRGDDPGFCISGTDQSVCAR